MATREQVTKPAPQDKAEAELKDKLDDLLDEVDTILNEEGVEQLVNFKQRGGQ